MDKSEEKKYQILFARDKAFARTGVLFTFGMLIILVLGGFLLSTAPEDELWTEGNHLMALVIMSASFVVAIAYWVYFIVIHNKVRSAVKSFALQTIKEDKNLIPFLKEECRLVFRYKQDKKFVLFEKDKPSIILMFTFKDFISLYDGDVTFYRETVKALREYFYHALAENEFYKNVKIEADFSDSKRVYPVLTIVSDGIVVRDDKNAKK